MSSGDWYRRDEASKKDVATKLLTSFGSVKAQAGGDPDDITLIINDDRDHMVAKCTPSAGVRIYE